MTGSRPLGCSKDFEGTPSDILSYYRAVIPHHLVVIRGLNLLVLLAGCALLALAQLGIGADESIA